jgi:hypothetical protein
MIRKTMDQPSAERNGAQGKNGQRFRKAMTPIKEKRVTKLTIDKRVFTKLEIEAKLRGVTMSELANTVLDDALDEYEVKITKVEKPKAPRTEANGRGSAHLVELGAGGKPADN